MRHRLFHECLAAWFAPVLLLAFAGLSGCGGKPIPPRVPMTKAPVLSVPTAPQDTAPPEVKSEETSAASVGVVPTAEVDVVQAEPPINKVEPSEPTIVAEPATIATEIVTVPPQLERFILFAPGGPLIFEVDIQVAGKPLAQAFDAIAAQAQTAADTDGDGRGTWSEVKASLRFQAGEFGNLPFTSAEEQKQITDRYDLDKDGLVDREELPRFLTRNAGGSRPFSFRGTSEWRFKNRRGAPLWQQIDLDRDGSLNAEEIASLPASLRLRDDNDDEIIMPQELQTATADGTEMPRRFRGTSAGMVLTASTDWTTLRSALEQHYALGRDLVRENLGQSAALFDHLDENKNGRLERKEFARILNHPATVRLRLQLDTNQAKLRNSPWEVVATSPDFAGKIAPCPNGLLLRLANCTLKVVLNDTVGMSNYLQQAEQILTQYDGDANGYLEKKEIPEAAATLYSFAALDADTNGKVYVPEIATLLERQQSALRCQVHVKGSDRDDAVFVWLDTNADERLEMREIHAGVKDLQELLAVSENGVHGDQLPDSMLLVFARGNLETADALFVPPPTTVATATDRPAWFIGMDANGDGTISQREFIGSTEQFQAFDANQDAYLTWDEFPDELRRIDSNPTTENEKESTDSVHDES